MKIKNITKSLIKACLEMQNSGLVKGTSGNISHRVKDGMIITPSAVNYSSMKPKSIVRVDQNGHFSRDKKPSSEWRFHLDIYLAKEDVNAVVHTHSPYATALAIQNLPIPAIHYMIAAAGGNDIKVASYATFGTKQLSKNIMLALEGRTACLIEHHGVVACGKSFKEALNLASEVENLAKQYWIILSAGMTPRLLSDESMAEVHSKMGAYQKGDAGRE